LMLARRGEEQVVMAEPLPKLAREKRR